MLCIQSANDKYPILRFYLKIKKQSIIEHSFVGANIMPSPCGDYKLIYSQFIVCCHNPFYTVFFKQDLTLLAEINLLTSVV